MIRHYEATKMVVIEQEGDIDLAFSAYTVLFDIVYLQRSSQTILPKTLYGQIRRYLNHTTA